MSIDKGPGFSGCSVLKILILCNLAEKPRRIRVLLLDLRNDQAEAGLRFQENETRRVRGTRLHRGPCPLPGTDFFPNLLASLSFTLRSTASPFVFRLSTMVRLAGLISYASLFAVCIAAPDDATKNRQGLTKVSPNSGLNSRALSPRSLLQKRCQGTCEECFGAGYTECPGSDYYCYLPGDAEYGIDSCSSTGSSYTSTTAAASPTTTGSAGNSDYCSGPDATCVTCFGPGYLQCSDGISCCMLR